MKTTAILDEEGKILGYLNYITEQAWSKKEPLSTATLREKIIHKFDLSPEEVNLYMRVWNKHNPNL